jgi:hypothetical protein
MDLDFAPTFRPLKQDSAISCVLSNKQHKFTIGSRVYIGWKDAGRRVLGFKNWNKDFVPQEDNA